MTSDSKAVDVLIRSLTNPKWEMRQLAAQRLGALGTKAIPAIPALVSLLRKDPFAAVRGWAASALGSIGELGNGVGDALIAALEDEQWVCQGDLNLTRVSDCASSALIALGNAAIPYVVRALDSADQKIRAQAVFVLQGIQPLDPSIVDRLRQAITSDPNPYVRDVARGVLAGMAEQGVGDSLQSLRSLLDDPAEPTRANAALALGRQGCFEEKVLVCLLSLLRNLRDTSRRNQLVTTFSSAGESAVPYLVEALSDSHAQVRQTAAQILGRIGPDAKDAGAALLQCVPDEKRVRRAAIRALRKVDPELADEADH